ncbi:hypothetical protein LTR16_001554 [Cryomyces antarcticus]|uniref:Carbonic anhydrase n=1 Tax=Cryomyces antarcticus TaxID=329879 RepID=A0ABR0KTV1_9PEZI|nr:hypothetical protein LTR16_001554 [Cryomyces antarcticus]
MTKNPQPPSQSSASQDTSGSSHPLDFALARNKAWVYQTRNSDPDLFARIGSGQSPEILWIGCADSRIPETTVLGLKPGDVFVHRNIANIVNATDLSALSVIHYAVVHLKVKHVIVCGHTSCGGVAGALGNARLGILDSWLQPLRQVRAQHTAELEALAPAERALRLSELGVRHSLEVLRQNADVIDAVTERGLQLHGLIFNVGTGELSVLDEEEGETEKEVRGKAFALK